MDDQNARTYAAACSNASQAPSNAAAPAAGISSQASAPCMRLQYVAAAAIAATARCMTPHSPCRSSLAAASLQSQIRARDALATQLPLLVQAVLGVLAPPLSAQAPQDWPARHAALQVMIQPINNQSLSNPLHFSKHSL